MEPAGRWKVTSESTSFWAEALDEVTVVLDVVLLDVGEETTTLADQHEEAATGVEVLLVGLHVLGELLDAGGQDGDLDLGGTGIVLVLAVLLDELGLLLLGDHALIHLSWDWPLTGCAVGGAGNQVRGAYKTW